ncbi:MAG TPA: winged helix-turn-helix domain-containing protein [Streptosporangiaceae bacterium]|jgi:DNA-binding transcriptional ArsR family regulator
MVLDPDSIARFAGLLADRSRAAMCLVLLDGRAWTAAELADAASISRPTATGHLNQLVQAGLLAEVRQGRHRYLRLASPELAQVIEDIAAAVGQPAPARSLRTVRAAADMAAARTCYDHLAGTLGVAIYDAMVASSLLDVRAGLHVTERGRSWFTELAGADVLRPAGSRPLVRACLDWTERRTHLGGALGAAMRGQFAARSWVSPARGSRAVRLTPAGRDALRELLGITLAPDQAPPALTASLARAD